MRYKEDHKDQTRERIIDTAASLFKERGVDAVGIATIMQSAKLTNGAFYAHFESKRALVEAVINIELTNQLTTFEGVPNNKMGLRIIIETYLSTEHRINCVDGCPSAALIGDIIKLGENTKTIYAARLNNVKGQIEERIPKSHSNNAYAIFGLLIGTLQLARSVSDLSEAEEILASGRHAALQLAGL
jgi:TetR/AcrR family transcriptional regulator, transcriptional repressor for nem operon